MTALGAVTFGNALLCEDARQDINNKYILTGVFSEDIIVSEMPARISLALYVELRADTVGSLLITLRLTAPNSDSVSLKAALEIQKVGALLTIITPRIDVLIAQEGEIRLDVSLDEQEWVSLFSKRVSQGVLPSASPQPSEKYPRVYPGSSSQP